MSASLALFPEQDSPAPWTRERLAEARKSNRPIPANAIRQIAKLEREELRRERLRRFGLEPGDPRADQKVRDLLALRSASVAAGESTWIRGRRQSLAAWVRDRGGER